MEDVVGKEVWLNAVSKEGKDVIVENDFSIHIEYGNYYLCYENALENEPVFIIKQPSLVIDAYDEKGIEDAYFPNMGLFPGNGLFQFIKIGDTKTKDDSSNIDMDISDIMGVLADNSGDLATQLWSAEVAKYDNMRHLLEYDKKSVVIRDEQKIKAGYFTTNRFGKTNYNIVLITSNHVYYAPNCKFWDDIDEDEVVDNEKFLERLLNSVKSIKEDDKPESKQKNNKKKVEKNIEDNVLGEDFLIGLKMDAENIYSCFSLIAKKLGPKKFNKAANEELDDDIDEFIDFIFNIDGVDSRIVSYRYAGFRNDFELIYYPNYVRPVDMSEWLFPFDYYIVVTLLESDGSFNPNGLAKRLIKKINELDKDKIFNTLIDSAQNAIKEGKKLESILSEEFIQKQLDESGNKYEVQGTQYEGRTDRIEKLKVGDKLKLIRELDNEHDHNAIEITNRSGSIGHLPWDAANILSPVIDSGLFTAEAEVIDVTPLSKRSSRAKKALLYVKINTKKNVKRKTTKESSVKSEVNKKYISDEKSGKKPEEKEKNLKQLTEKTEKVVQQKKKELDSSISKMVRERRAEYKELERGWRRVLDEHQNRISSKVYMSEFEVKSDMKRIIVERDNYGKKYDSLIKTIDIDGKYYIKEGCSAQSVKKISDLIEEIIDESSALDIDFGTNGMMTLNLGSTKFSVSVESKSIKRWWLNKYEDMPEIKNARKKEELNEELTNVEKLLKEKQKERKNMDEREQALNSSIKESTEFIEQFELNYESYKNSIDLKYSPLIQNVNNEIVSVNNEIKSLENSINSIQMQIASLSLFKRTLKKQLTQRVEGCNVRLNELNTRLYNANTYRNNLNGNYSNELMSLSNKLSSEKTNLNNYNNELSDLPAKKSKLDKEIEELEEKEKSIRNRLEELK